MTTLKQLKAARPNDYIEIPWKEMGNGYYKIYGISKKEIITTGMFFKGTIPKGFIPCEINEFYRKNPKFKVIPWNSKKAKTIEGKLGA